MKELFELIPKNLRYAAGGTELADLLWVINGTSSLLPRDLDPDSYAYEVWKCQRAIQEIFIKDLENEEEKIKLIDWEYAAMQDIHLDIAMFCIYSMYNRQQVDNLIDIYFENKCDQQTRIKIYCYISMCGLLWSNWCEYKYTLGVEFGKYSLAQYRFAKDYYNIVIEEMENMK